MTDKWKANVGQLRLVGGNRLEYPTNLKVTEQRSILPVSGRGKGQLHVLVELSGETLGREELAQDLANAISEEYTHTPGTVTYGLRQAILLANTHLLRANERISSERRLGGVACVVLRDGEIFVAQAGWPMVYLIHGDHVQTFPDTMLEDEDTSMLGQRQTTEVRLFHANTQSGDTILMVDGPMARQLGITRIGQIVSGSIEQAMSNLETLAPPEDCTAMVIHVGSSPSSAQAEQWDFMPVDTSPMTDAEPEDEPSSESPISEEFDLDEPGPESMDFEREPAYRRRTRREPAIGDRVNALLGTIGNGARALGERLLPDRQPQRTTSQRRRTTRTRRDRGQESRPARWGIAVVVAIPILVLAFVGIYTAYRNWSLQSQFNAYLDAAKSKRELALSTAESPMIARDYWIELITNVDEAAKLQPENTELVELRAQAESAIDRIDGVTRMSPIYRLYTYDQPGSSPSRIVVAGLDVYVLDRGTERVYHHALNELRTEVRNPNADPVLVQQGQSVEGQSVGSLLDIAWMQNGGERQAGALVILDRDGLLLEYDPAWEKFKVERIGGQDVWRSPVALRTFDSNLYVLDSAANQIWKYWNKQYANEPDRWMQQSDADLSKAADLGIDGNIGILFTDGRVIKYFAGEPVPFTQTRIPKPLANANALYLVEEEVAQYIYIVDRAESRIVQLDREGVFVRQLQPARDQSEWFQGLAGISVDETGGKLYFTAANALNVTELPATQH